MPGVLIETRAGWIASPEAVLSAVHAAAQALKLPVPGRCPPCERCKRRRQIIKG